MENNEALYTDNASPIAVASIFFLKSSKVKQKKILKMQWMILETERELQFTRESYCSKYLITRIILYLADLGQKHIVCKYKFSRTFSKICRTACDLYSYNSALYVAILQLQVNTSMQDVVLSPPTKSPSLPPPHFCLTAQPSLCLV